MVPSTVILHTCRYSCCASHTWCNTGKLFLCQNHKCYINCYKYALHSVLSMSFIVRRDLGRRIHSLSWERKQKWESCCIWNKRGTSTLLRPKLCIKPWKNYSFTLMIWQTHIKYKRGWETDAEHIHSSFCMCHYMQQSSLSRVCEERSRPLQWGISPC